MSAAGRAPADTAPTTRRGAPAQTSAGAARPGAPADTSGTTRPGAPAPTAAGAALAVLATEARSCTRCDLYRDATQTVFGAGPGDAPMVLVGEQPGDQEDRQGAPFVGPAGTVLADALAAAGVDSDRVYVTNAVKHFKFTRQGKRRIHQKPNAAEQAACRPWLDQELATVHPAVIVALGATAAANLLGRAVRIGAERGQPLEGPGGARVVITAHPSSILRVRDGDSSQEAFDALVADLVTARSLLGAEDARP